MIWTPLRVRQTLLAIGTSVGAGVAIAIAAAFSAAPGPEPAAMAGGSFGGGCWILLSTWFWRQTPQERLTALRGAGSDEPIACPICGYNLAGLYEARCPECGTRDTLEELLRATKWPSDVDEVASAEG